VVCERPSSSGRHLSGRLLLRRGWAPKDFKHVRPALEHLTTLEVLERERRPGRRSKWLYRKTDKLGERIKIVEREAGDSPTAKQGPYVVTLFSHFVTA
jgi:hypothetical protein